MILQGSLRLSIKRDAARSAGLCPTMIVRQGETNGAFAKTSSPVDHGTSSALTVVVPFAAAIGLRFSEE